MRTNKLEPIYAHFEIDQYDPCFMPKNSETEEYEIVRAVPPTENPKFFISHRGRPKISTRYEMTYIDTPISRDMHFTENSHINIRIMMVQSHETYGDASDLT